MMKMLRKELEISDDAKVKESIWQFWLDFHPVLTSYIFLQVEDEPEDESSDDKDEAPAEDQDGKKEEL